MYVVWWGEFNCIEGFAAES